MAAMNTLSDRTHRRRQGAHASAVLGLLFVLLAMVSCCSIAFPGSAAHHRSTHTAAVDRTLTPAHPVAVRTVVADAPG